MVFFQTKSESQKMRTERPLAVKIVIPRSIWNTGNNWRLKNYQKIIVVLLSVCHNHNQSVKPITHQSGFLLFI